MQRFYSLVVYATYLYVFSSSVVLGLWIFNVLQAERVTYEVLQGTLLIIIGAYSILCWLRQTKTNKLHYPNGFTDNRVTAFLSVLMCVGLAVWGYGARHYIRGAVRQPDSTYRDNAGRKYTRAQYLTHRKASTGFFIAWSNMGLAIIVLFPASNAFQQKPVRPE